MHTFFKVTVLQVKETWGEVLSFLPRALPTAENLSPEAEFLKIQFR
jgi:hypothetical protein